MAQCIYCKHEVTRGESEAAPGGVYDGSGLPDCWDAPRRPCQYCGSNGDGPGCGECSDTGNSWMGLHDIDDPYHHMAREPDTCGRESDARTVIARWVLRENEDGSRECATLYAMHFRGLYRAVVNRTQYLPDRGNGVSGELSAIMDTVEVLRRPTTRYSARALDAFATEAIAVINDPMNAKRFAHKFDADIPV